MRRLLGVLLVLVLAFAVGCSSSDKEDENNKIPGEAYVSGEFYNISTPLDMTRYFVEAVYTFNIDYEDRDEDRDGSYLCLGEDEDAIGVSLEFPQRSQVWEFWLDEDGNITDVQVEGETADIDVEAEAETIYADFTAPFAMTQRWIPPLTDVDAFVDAGWQLSNARTLIRDLGIGNMNVDVFWFKNQDGDEFYFEVVKYGDLNVFVSYEVTEEGTTYSFTLSRLILK